MARIVKVRVERFVSQHCTVMVEADDDATDGQVMAAAYAAAGYDSAWEDDQSGDEEEGTHAILEEFDGEPDIDLTEEKEEREHPNAIRQGWIYLQRDTARAPDEGQYYAEVVAQLGRLDEQLLHTTTWYTDPHSPINEAEEWMRANGVEEEDV